VDRHGPAGFNFGQSGGSTIITSDDDPGSSITLIGVNTLQLLAHARSLVCLRRGHYRDGDMSLRD
jgi:hypothetical protein